MKFMNVNDRVMLNRDYVDIKAGANGVILSEPNDNSPTYTVELFTYKGDSLGTCNLFSDDIDLVEKGLKEAENKVDYTEIDWDFIDGICNRITENDKYPKHNWKKEMDIKELAAATIRHARKILDPIKGDPESIKDHTYAIACNAMFINYQLKLKKDENMENTCDMGNVRNHRD